MPNPHYRGPESELDDERSTFGAEATATVDNLWKYLQDMIEDPVVKSIYLVLSNIHCLEANDATTTLLDRLRENALSVKSKQLPDCKARWLVTSRNDTHICQYLTTGSISLIDLENDSAFGGKVRVARQKHAKNAVKLLRSTKKYSPDLAYYVRNSIESQSEDEKWIDVLCILLRAMPSEFSSLSVRKWLRQVGDYNIHRLVDHAWDEVRSCP